MISQQQKNIHVPEEETPPPLDQEHAARSASWWRSWSLWLRILGVVLALTGVYVGSALGGFVTSVFGYNFAPFGLVLYLLVWGVSAGLIRSWWSLLIVPALSVGGLLIPILLYGFTNGMTFDLFSMPATPEGKLVMMGFLILLGFIETGVVIGTPFGKMIEKQVRH